LEEAGFEIRDQLVWCFPGVPKSRRMPGGLGSGLRPAWEPVVLARKPLDPKLRTITANLSRYGTGALNIDQGRIARADDPREGYWPANLVLSHDSECQPASGECTPDCPLPIIDRVAAKERSSSSPAFSRLFYAAKATRAEREAGLDHLAKRPAPIFSGGSTQPRACTHPTVKPLSLMGWLVRLVTPPGGLVLDPFAGSGSTLIAAVQEGRAVLGIERDPEYTAIARGRIAHWAGRQR
jgi:site-specific DNA-methyltransferase (adenine-specific)